jgi:thioredoxin 1
VDAVTDATFDAEVLQSERPVVVDFWAPWCGPCKAVAPVLEALAAEHPGVKFVKLDIDGNPAVASRLGILSIPTVTVFDGGEAKQSVVGARPRGHFEKVLGPWLASG